MSFLSSLRRRDGYTAIVVAALFTLFAAIIVLFLPSDEVAELSKQEKTRERVERDQPQTDAGHETRTKKSTHARSSPWKTDVRREL